MNSLLLFIFQSIAVLPMLSPNSWTLLLQLGSEDDRQVAMCPLLVAIIDGVEGCAQGFIHAKRELCH